MQDPALVPDAVRKRLSEVGLWDIDPVNLFRITWKNDPATGLYNEGNWIEFPPELTGVPARIVGWWSASGFPPAPTRWARPSAAWCRG
jgi:cysteine synthase A